MRKFLRFLMLVLITAYGTVGWGDTVKFRAGNNDNSEKEINPPTEDNRTIAKDEFVLTVDGNSNFNADHGSLGADCWFIEKNSYLTIKSTHKMIHIFFSFSRKDWLITEHHGGERLELSSGGGTWTPCKEIGGDVGIGKWKKHVTFGYRNGYWHNDSGSTEVKFKAKDDRCDILWIKIWYDASTSDDNNTTTGNIKINNSTSKSDVWFNSDTYPVEVSTTSNYYNSFTWSLNGTAQSGTSARLTTTSTITAVGTKTVGAQDGDSDMKDTNDNSTITTHDTFTQHFYQYWDVSTANGAHKENGATKYYATFCHKNIMKVPDNCTAWTYIKRGNLMKPSKSIEAGNYIPGSTPVIICSDNTAQSTLRFTNPDRNLATTADVSGVESEFKGNETGSAKDVSGDIYFLMRNPNNTSELRFMRYSGQCPAHACYLDLSSSSAKSFVFQFPDDDETTGISGVTADRSALDPSAPMYNAAGQRVGASYKGIVIQNGRKFIKR